MVVSYVLIILKGLEWTIQVHVYELGLESLNK
jgi:hypothetical protein